MDWADRFEPYRDWVESVRFQLVDAGYHLPPSASDEDVALSWLNVCRRIIAPQPRKVLRPNEFRRRPDEAYPLAEFVRRAEAGRSLNHLLSKKLLEPRYQDKLLFDWGIHHFHLNVTREASGFAARSDRLLFARVTDDVIYLIAVGDHGSWTDQMLIEILHRNWPDAIESFRLRGVLAPTKTSTRAERISLRRAGAQTFVHTEDGATYFPIGGGYATDGSSMRVTQDLIELKHHFRELQRIVRESRDQIREEAWAAGLNPQDLHLRLVYAGEQPYAEDEEVRFRVALPRFAAT